MTFVRENEIVEGESSIILLNQITKINTCINTY